MTMFKRDSLRREVGDNIRESCGIGRPPQPAQHAGPVSEKYPGADRSRNAVEVPVELIDRDETQPREHFDEAALGRLAESLKARGQLQPIRVRRSEAAGRYVILMGERRWRAARLAGLPRLTCIVHDGAIDDGERLALQLVENALREDLKPVEQAQAYRRLMEANGWTMTRLADELHIDKSSVSRAMALLELPREVQDRVDEGELPAITAAEIARADPDDQTSLAERAVAEKMTRSDVIAEIGSRSSARRKSKGRGGARKVTKRVFKLHGGIKVTIERAKGIDDETIRTAAEGLLSQATPGEHTIEVKGPSSDAEATFKPHGASGSPIDDAEQGRGVAA